MKVTLRLLFGLLVGSSLIVSASADDRYRSGVPTTAPVRSAMQLKTTAPVFQTAADPRPGTATSTRTELPPRADLAPRVEAAPAPAINDVTAPAHVPLSLSTLNPTPEMWFYEQMRQDYNNPELQVRRNSEQAAQQRRARIASSAWFGVYNSRPMAYTTPHMYHYSPSWTGGSSRTPYYWNAAPSTRIYVESRRNYAGIGTW